MSKLDAKPGVPGFRRRLIVDDIGTRQTRLDQLIVAVDFENQSRASIFDRKEPPGKIVFVSPKPLSLGRVQMKPEIRSPAIAPQSPE